VYVDIYSIPVPSIKGIGGYTFGLSLPVLHIVRCHKCQQQNTHLTFRGLCIVIYL